MRLFMNCFSRIMSKLNVHHRFCFFGVGGPHRFGFNGIKTFHTECRNCSRCVLILTRNFVRVLGNVIKK